MGICILDHNVKYQTVSYRKKILNLLGFEHGSNMLPTGQCP